MVTTRSQRKQEKPQQEEQRLLGSDHNNNNNRSDVKMQDEEDDADDELVFKNYTAVDEQIYQAILAKRRRENGPFTIFSTRPAIPKVIKKKGQLLQ